MYNSGINENVHYRVIIYDKNDEIIEDIHIIGQDNAYNYGEKRIIELGKQSYFHVKVI